MQNDFSEHSCADEAARTDGQRHRNNAPGKTLKGVDILAERQAAVSKHRRRDGQEPYLLRIVDDPVAGLLVFKIDKI